MTKNLVKFDSFDSLSTLIGLLTLLDELKSLFFSQAFLHFLIFEVSSVFLILADFCNAPMFYVLL